MEWLGPWQLDVARYALVSVQEVRELEPLIFRLAAYFFAHPQRIIARQELAEQVWQQAYVDDNAINRAISDLRKALQHPALSDTVLKTHHRKGYSLQWHVELQQQFLAEQTRFMPLIAPPIAQSTFNMNVTDAPSLAAAIADSSDNSAGHSNADATTAERIAAEERLVSASLLEKNEISGQPSVEITSQAPTPSARQYPVRAIRWPLVVVAAILLIAIGLVWLLPLGQQQTQDQHAAEQSDEAAVAPVVQITSEEGIAAMPQLSTDRRLLAYSQVSTGQLGQIRVQRYQQPGVASVVDGISLELAGHHLAALNWQPGRPVLLVQATAKESNACSYRLYDFSAYPAYQQRTLDAPCSDSMRVRAILSADGQMLYRPFRPADGQSEQLIQHDLATGQQQVLINSHGTAMGLLDVALSPDGQQLAYVRLDSSKAGFIYLYHLQKQEQIQLTDFSQTGPILQLAFSLTGQYLYGMNGAELVQLRLSDRRVLKWPLPQGFSGGELSLLDAQTAVVSEVSVRLSSRSGSMVVAELKDIFKPHQASIRWFWQGKGSIAAVTPDPTNPQRLAFVHADERGWQLWLREAGQDRQLTEMPANTQPINHLAWSPDGQQLVFSRDKVLWRYQFQTQSLTQLHPLAEFSFPVFDPSGQSLVVQRDVAKQQQLWRLQLASGQLQRLGLHQGSVPQFADGELYYYRGLQLMRYVDGGKGDQLIAADSGQLNGTYRVSQGWVYYFAQQQREFRRFRLTAPEQIERVSLQQLQLASTGVPISFTLQGAAVEPLFVNMMMFPQLHLYQLHWPVFAE